MLVINNDQVQEIYNIASGIYAPLEGFLAEKDYMSVLSDMRLADGRVWSIPIVLDIDKNQRLKIKDQKLKFLELVNENGEVIARLEDFEVYGYDKKMFAQKVYGTTDDSHPGVAMTMLKKEFLLGGKLVNVKIENSDPHVRTPAEVKRIIGEKNWQSVVAFQTRNVPHRGHEFLQHQALLEVDGLLIHPVVGEKKHNDFKDEYIIAAYQLLIDQGYYSDRALLSALPLKMHYAGPREALHHALIRKNFGCTHFIVGRDHAGVGDFYHPSAAQAIFDQFDPAELGIEILKYDEVVWDRRRERHCFVGECAAVDRVSFSGTRLRECIEQRTAAPEHLVRPEVYDFLINAHNSLVDDMYKKNNNKKGFVLWFTGLSASGKTSIADRVSELLAEQGVGLERLDGDIVRENLTRDLGFSKADRDENIRRIGFVANLLSRNNVGVIASFISPYRAQRAALREQVHNFIEIFVDTPLAVCEARDPKGMSKRARAGEIALFTGVSDPYEAPEQPELHLLNHEISIEENARRVVDYLRAEGIVG